MTFKCCIHHQELNKCHPATWGSEHSPYPATLLVKSTHLICLQNSHQWIWPNKSQTGNHLLHNATKKFWKGMFSWQWSDSTDIQWMFSVSFIASNKLYQDHIFLIASKVTWTFFFLKKQGKFGNLKPLSPATCLKYFCKECSCFAPVVSKTAFVFLVLTKLVLMLEHSLDNRSHSQMVLSSFICIICKVSCPQTFLLVALKNTRDPHIHAHIDSVPRQ